MQRECQRSIAGRKKSGFFRLLPKNSSRSGFLILSSGRGLTMHWIQFCFGLIVTCSLGCSASAFVEKDNKVPASSHMIDKSNNTPTAITVSDSKELIAWLDGEVLKCYSIKLNKLIYRSKLPIRSSSTTSIMKIDFSPDDTALIVNSLDDRWFARFDLTNSRKLPSAKSPLIEKTNWYFIVSDFHTRP